MPYAKINKSGCCERHGNLQIRIDFFLEPTDPRYLDTYVQVPVIPPEGYTGKVDKEGNPKDQAAYDLWLASLPKVWQLNPFHSHFIYVPPEVTDAEIKAEMDFHLPNFYKVFQEYQDKEQGGMRKGFAVEKRIRPVRYSKTLEASEYDLLKIQVDSRLAILPVLQSTTDVSEGKEYPSTDISIGPGATSRASLAPAAYTQVDHTVAANADGIIDTVELYPYDNMGGVEVAIFRIVSGSTLATRDNETIGTVTAGAPDPDIFTGLSMDVITGDYIGFYNTSGTLKRTDTGGAGWHYAADRIPTAEQAFTANTRIYSIYGTGETAGGATDYPISTSCGLTASATVAYAAAWDRATSPGLTISATIVRYYGHLITTIANLTANSVISRFMTYTRAHTTGLTISTTLTRVWGRIRSTVSNLTVSTTISRALTYTRATTPNLTAAVTILKGWGRTIATSAGLTVSATVVKVVTYKRAITSGLTVAVAVAKSINRIITTSAGLTISATISRAVGYIRATSSGLTVGVSIVATYVGGAVNYLITVVSNLAVSATIDKTVSYKRAISAGLTATVSIVKSFGRTITTSTGLKVSATINRIASYNRTLAAGLTASTTINRILAYGKSTISNLTASVTIARKVTWDKIVSAGLSISVLISKRVSFKRIISAGLNVATLIVIISHAVIHYLVTVVSNLTISTTIVKTRGIFKTITANLTVSVVIRYCTVLRELLRIPISRIAAVRIPISRIARWRRKKECSDD